VRVTHRPKRMGNQSAGRSEKSKSTSGPSRTVVLSIARADLRTSRWLRRVSGSVLAFMSTMRSATHGGVVGGDAVGVAWGDAVGLGVGDIAGVGLGATAEAEEVLSQTQTVTTKAFTTTDAINGIAIVVNSVFIDTSEREMSRDAETAEGMCPRQTCLKWRSLCRSQWKNCRHCILCRSSRLKSSLWLTRRRS